MGHLNYTEICWVILEDSNKQEEPAMANELGSYKAFIDGLVGLKDGVLSKWIFEKGYPNTDDL